MAETVRQYSEHLGALSDDQLQRACDVFDLGALQQAEAAAAGAWGQNIMLTTSTGDFVLRGKERAAGQFAKERAVAAAINDGSSLASPWPYLVNHDAAILGWSYAVMPRLPGTMGSTLWDRADTDGRLALAAAHGEALAHLHEATFAAPGPFDVTRDAFVAVDNYAQWTIERVESLRSQCRAIDSLSHADERFVDTLLRDCAGALDEPFVPVLVHHDFSLANTNYATEHSDFRATGVFDLGETHVGDGEEDLVRFLFRRKSTQRAAFVDAYTGRHPFRPGASERLALYALADLLFMWQVSRRVTNWFGDDTFLDVAAPVVASARSVADRASPRKA